MPSIDSPHPPDLFEEHLPLGPVARELLFTAARTANTFAGEPVSHGQLRAVRELSTWLRPRPASLPCGCSTCAPRRPHLIARLAADSRPKSAPALMIAVPAYATQYTEHVLRLLPVRPEMKEGSTRGRPGPPPGVGPLQRVAPRRPLHAVRPGRRTGHRRPWAASPSGAERAFLPDGRLKSFLVINIGKPGDDPRFERLPRLRHERPSSCSNLGLVRTGQTPWPPRPRPHQAMTRVLAAAAHPRQETP